MLKLTTHRKQESLPVSRLPHPTFNLTRAAACGRAVVRLTSLALLTVHATRYEPADTMTIRASIAALVLVSTILTDEKQTCRALAPPNASRRTLLSSAATSFAVFQSSFLSKLPEEALAASLDPSVVNAPLVPGGRLQYRPSGEGMSWSPPPLTTTLGNARIAANELSPLNPSYSPFADRELYYAPFLFGSWNVTATLKRKLYPYGPDFVPSRSLVEGSPRNRQEAVGDSTTYELRFFSTLADTVANQVTVNLGLGVPQPKIIADRAFDAISISRAYRQLTPVQDVEWNPSNDPTRLSLSFGAGPLAEDMRPLGQRRGEVYITARDSEESGDSVFCACERSRSVTLAPGNAIVSDTESTTEYRLLEPNTIAATSRIAVYLTPNPNSREGVLWQQVGGKAVAFFDYDIEMKRNEEVFVKTDGSQVRRACVPTPKDIVQCA